MKSVAVLLLTAVTLFAQSNGWTFPCPWEGEMVCGTNGVTYTSICAFRLANFEANVGFLHQGPCRTNKFNNYPNDDDTLPVTIDTVSKAAKKEGNNGGFDDFLHPPNAGLIEKLLPNDAFVQNHVPERPSKELKKETHPQSVQDYDDEADDEERVKVHRHPKHKQKLNDKSKSSEEDRYRPNIYLNNSAQNNNSIKIGRAHPRIRLISRT